MARVDGRLVRATHEQALDLWAVRHRRPLRASADERAHQHRLIQEWCEDAVRLEPLAADGDWRRALARVGEAVGHERVALGDRLGRRGALDGVLRNGLL